MQALFDAVDISGATTNLTTLYIGFIGVAMLGLGYAWVRKTINKGK